MTPPSFLDEFIPLDRTFHELALEAGAGDDVELTRILGQRDALRWPNLLSEYRVILLSEAGSGKTEEIREYRSDIRSKLLELADTMPLAPMAALREKKVRAFVKETVGNLLINQRPN
jgi:hypothetical protein